MTSTNLSEPVTGNSAWTAAFTYDVLGNILTATDGNGVTRTNTYDRAGRVKTRTYSGEPAGLWNISYDCGEIDANGDGDASKLSTAIIYNRQLPATVNSSANISLTAKASESRKRFTPPVIPASSPKRPCSSILTAS